MIKQIVYIILFIICLPILSYGFSTDVNVGSLGGVTITNTPSGAGQCPTTTGTTTGIWGSCGSGNLPSIPGIGGQALFENGSSASWNAFSGDISCSTSSPGNCTVGSTQGTPFGSLATVNTSGNDLLVGNNSGGIANYAGISCTNQTLIGISANGSKSCATITSSYVDTSIALTGVDINTSNQVTTTHLSAPLPINQGGTGTTTPSLVQGTNITITGSWPNQTIAASGGAGGGVSTGAIGNASYYTGTSTVGPVSNTYHAGTGSFATALGNCAQAAWPTSAVEAVGNAITDINGNTEVVQSVTSDHKTGPSHPAWPVTVGNTITDNHVVWVLAAIGAFAPSTSCNIYLDPSQVYNVSTPVLVGINPGVAQTVYCDGAIVNCTDTTGTSTNGHACVVMGDWGHFIGLPGRGGSTSGCQIGNTVTTKTDSVLESYSAYSERLLNTKYIGTNFDVRNIAFNLNTSSSIFKAAVWESAVDGDGKFYDNFISAGPTSSVALLIDDGYMTNAACIASTNPYPCCTNPSTGTCNVSFWNNLNFIDNWIGLGNDGYGLKVIAANEGGGTFTWTGGAIVDGTSSTTSHMYIDGSASAIRTITFVGGPYIEVSSGEVGDGVELKGVNGTDISGMLFDSAGGELTNCIKVFSGGPGQLKADGSAVLSACTNVINNLASGYTRTTPGDFDYYYAGTTNGVLSVDGPSYFNSFGPQLYYSGTSIPSCTTALARQFTCVSDSTLCTSGTTYVSGGSTSCLLECNNAGNTWKETGVNCF